MPTGLGRLTSKSPSTGRTIVRAELSTTITKAGDYGLGSIPTHPAPGRARGLRLLSAPPAQSHLVHPARSVPQAPAHSTQPTPSRRPRWGTDDPLRPAGPDGGLTVT
jgi:hypothetical protein